MKQAPGYDMTSRAVMCELFKRFVDFCEFVWNVELKGAKLTPRQRELCDYLQDGPKKRAVFGFRGVGKSYIIATYADWRLMLDPTELILVVSGSPKKAAQVSGWARKLIDNPNLPMLHFLQPKPGKKGDRDALLSWDVAPSNNDQSSSFSAFSVGQGIQGQRATVVIADDSEMKNNSGSQLLRDRLLTALMDAAAMLIPESSEDFIVLGTFQSLQSIYNTLINERGFHAMILPARVPESIAPYNGHLMPSVAERVKDPSQHGKPTDTRFSHERLLEDEMALGPVQWMLEYMMTTELGDRMAHPFPLERLIVWDGVNPFGAPAEIMVGTGLEHRIQDLNFCGLAGDSFYGPSSIDTANMLPYSEKVLYIDPAGNSGVDQLSWKVLGAVPGKLYLIDSGKMLNGVDPKTLVRLVMKAKEWQVNRILYESNMVSWGPLFEQTMKAEGYACQIVGQPASTKMDKGTRIVSSLEAVIYGGNLVISRSVFENEWREGSRSGDKGWIERLLQYQLAMFRRGEKGGGLRIDDEVDCLALGVADLAPKYLDSQTSVAAKRYAELQAEQEYGDWASDMFGGEPACDLWVDA